MALKCQFVKTEAEKKVEALQKQHEDELREWTDFRSDLLTTIVVAERFKSEAESSVRRLSKEKLELTERLAETQGRVAKMERELKQATEISFAVRRSVKPTGEMRENCGDNVDSVMTPLHKQSDTHEMCTEVPRGKVSVKTLLSYFECSDSHLPTSDHVVSRDRCPKRSSNNQVRRNSNTGGANCGHSPATLKCSLTTQAYEEKKTDAPVDSQRLPPEMLVCTTVSGVDCDHFNTLSTRKPTPDSPSAAVTFAGVNLQEMPVRQEKKVDNVSVPRSADDALSLTCSAELASEDKVAAPVLSGGKADTLQGLAKPARGSVRNGLLNWCKERTAGYPRVRITNFSSSWNDGLAFCAVMHSYLPDRIATESLTCTEKRRNLAIAFDVAESVGIEPLLNVDHMVSAERPEWKLVMTYVLSMYKHFECDTCLLPARCACREKPTLESF